MLPPGSAIEQMLADCHVIRDQARACDASTSERHLCTFGTPPLRRKATLAATSTTWKWRARDETGGTVGNLAIAVLQLEATPAYMALAG